MDKHISDAHAQCNRIKQTNADLKRHILKLEETIKNLSSQSEALGLRYPETSVEKASRTYPRLSRRSVVAMQRERLDSLGKRSELADMKLRAAQQYQEVLENMLDMKRTELRQQNSHSLSSEHEMKTQKSCLKKLLAREGLVSEKLRIARRDLDQLRNSTRAQLKTKEEKLATSIRRTMFRELDESMQDLELQRVRNIQKDIATSTVNQSAKAAHVVSGRKLSLMSSLSAAVATEKSYELQFLSLCRKIGVDTPKQVLQHILTSASIVNDLDAQLKTCNETIDKYSESVAEWKKRYTELLAGSHRSIAEEIGILEDMQAGLITTNDKLQSRRLHHVSKLNTIFVQCHGLISRVTKQNVDHLTREVFAKSNIDKLVAKMKRCSHLLGESQPSSSQKGFANLCLQLAGTAGVTRLPDGWTVQNPSDNVRIDKRLGTEKISGTDEDEEGSLDSWGAENNLQDMEGAENLRGARSQNAFNMLEHFQKEQDDAQIIESTPTRQAIKKMSKSLCKKEM